MAGITVKRNVILRAIVTDGLKEQVGRELQQAADEVSERLQQLDASTRAYITDLQRADLQRAMAVRKQIEAEKQKQVELRDALLERKAQIQELQNGTEVIRGTLEGFVEVNVGDDLALLLGGTEILTKDDQVLEIRMRSVLDEPEAQATPSIILPGDIRSGE
jgi:DNA repair exonuclease SbcCD ATPase subunit